MIHELFRKSVHSKMLLLATLGGIGMNSLLILALALGAPLRIRAQSRPDSQPSFEVVSIRLNRTGGISFLGGRSPGEFSWTNANIKSLIQFAYGEGMPQPWVHVYADLRDDQVVGGPGWMSTQKYDIEAKVPDLVAEKYRGLSGFEMVKMTEVRRLMVQSLLADRFQLQVRHETRTGAIYTLVVAKGGPKFRPGNDARFKEAAEITAQMLKNPFQPPKGLVPCAEGTRCHHSLTSMSLLAEILSRLPEVGRPVVDQTGLKGIYYLDFYWAKPPVPNPMGIDGNNGPPDIAPLPESSAPPIFTALQQQLGLKLQPTRGPVEYLVIDHIDRPTEN